MPLRRVACALLVVVVGASCSAGSEGAGRDDPGPADRCPGLAEPFDAWAEAGFSGTIAISTGGRLDCLAAYGAADGEVPNTVDTVFSIGSITKSFTAAAIFTLVDDGAVALRDRAGAHVAGLTGPAAEATIEHLLTHTSGLTGTHAGDDQPLDREQAVTAISELSLAFPPGSEVLYSNAGYTLLALIVEATAGTSYRDYLASRILPLSDGTVAGGFWAGEPAAPGPRAVGVLDDGPADEPRDLDTAHWALDGNGGLAMTTADLAAWTHALFRGRIVSSASVDRLRTATVDRGDGTAETAGWVALDATVLGEPALAAAGGGDGTGHNAVVVWLPDRQRAIAMASNTAALTAEDLLQVVGPALVADDPLPLPRADERDPDASTLRAVAGRYELGTDASFDVAAADGRLAISASGPDAVAALFPPPDDVGASEVATHEADVLALLSGRSREGRDERAALESDLGALDAIELAGTVHRDGELRTYVTLTAGTELVLVWYALDRAGSIAAAEITDERPTRSFVSAGEGFRPDEPTGAADVTVTFADGRMTITGSEGSTVAWSAAGTG